MRLCLFVLSFVSGVARLGCHLNDRLSEYLLGLFTLVPTTCSSWNFEWVGSAYAVFIYSKIC